MGWARSVHNASAKCESRQTERAGHDISEVKQQVWLVNAPLRTFAARWRRRRSELAMDCEAACSLLLDRACPAAARGIDHSCRRRRGRRSTAAPPARRCRARSRIAAKGKVQAIAGFAFTPDRRRWGEFHAQLSRMPRPGSSAMLNIGGQPFLLVARGGWAWSRGPAAGAGDHRRRSRSSGDADRGPRRRRAPLRRHLCARRRADRDRCGGGALRPSRRWQNRVKIT